MKVSFLKKFSKDLDKIKQPKDRLAILDIIELVKEVRDITEVPATKKLKGHNDAFRIRSGDYRIGVFVTGRVGRVCKNYPSQRHLHRLSLNSKLA